MISQFEVQVRRYELFDTVFENRDHEQRSNLRSNFALDVLGKWKQVSKSARDYVVECCAKIRANVAWEAREHHSGIKREFE